MGQSHGTAVKWPRNGCKKDVEIKHGVPVLQVRNRKPRPQLTRARTIEDEKCRQVRWVTSSALTFRRPGQKQNNMKTRAGPACVKGSGFCCCVWRCGGCFHGKLRVPECQPSIVWTQQPTRVLSTLLWPQWTDLMPTSSRIRQRRSLINSS